MKYRIAFVFLAASMLAACSKQDIAAPPSAPAAASPEAAAPIQNSSSGKILQLLQAGPYTYAEVQTADGQTLWLAGGHLDAKEGENLQWGRAEEMRNFNAKSLGRVFDRILFVNVWAPAGGGTVQVPPHGTPSSPHPTMGMTPSSPTATASTGSANTGQVKTVANAGGYTYLEILKGSETVWIAIPETTTVKAGEKVSWDGGMEMKNFNAKSLNRVFDQIIFAGRVTVLK